MLHRFRPAIIAALITASAIAGAAAATVICIEAPAWRAAVERVYRKLRPTPPAQEQHRRTPPPPCTCIDPALRIAPGDLTAPAIAGLDTGTSGKFWVPVPRQAIGPVDPVQAFADVDFATPPAVPEPQQWGMMLVGFALIGRAVRRRRATAQ